MASWMREFLGKTTSCPLGKRIAIQQKFRRFASKLRMDMGGALGSSKSV